MNTPPADRRFCFPRNASAIAGLALVLASGCSGQAERSAPPEVAAPSETGPVRITLDGDIGEWPAGMAAEADGDYLYIRTSVDGPERTLQAMGDRTLELWIDADSDPATGVKEAKPRAAGGLGVDLEVRFSPLKDGTIGDGVAVSVPVSGGERVRLGHADAGVMFLPTYAAHDYEIRLSRHMAEVPGGIAGGVLSGKGLATLMLVMMDKAGTVKGWSDPFTVELPARSGARPRTVMPLPGKGEDEVRVMTWNVLKSAPMSNPEPFARIIKAVGPDILLLQEWAEGGRGEIEGWLNERVGGEWQVVKSRDGDVAVASRYRVDEVGADRIRLEENRAVRFVAARVGTPIGPVIAGSAHLKCCGSIGSDEDVRRLAEAGAINGVMKGVFDRMGGIRVIGGDMNLVGSRPPLDALRAGLDGDGSDLDLVDAMVWGDRAAYTWSDATNDFSPGRLDYLVVGESSAEAVRSFVVDLSLLSDSALLGMGVERGDAGASDHLPVVVDLKGR